MRRESWLDVAIAFAWPVLCPIAIAFMLGCILAALLWPVLTVFAWVFR